MVLRSNRISWHNWGKCASYDLEDLGKGQKARRIYITSPVEVQVILHSKEQTSIPLELSTQMRLDGRHEVMVGVKKTIDVNQKRKPCYIPEDHDGESYGEHDYKLLNKIISDKFNCTTPYIPKDYRNGSKICTDETVGKKVHRLFKRALVGLNTNIWMEDFYSIPPCVYHTYKTEKTRKDGELIHSLHIFHLLHCR